MHPVAVKKRRLSTWMNHAVAGGTPEIIASATELLEIPDTAFQKAPGFQAYYLVVSLEDPGEIISVRCGTAPSRTGHFMGKRLTNAFSGVWHTWSASRPSISSLKWKLKICWRPGRPDLNSDSADLATIDGFIGDPMREALSLGHEPLRFKNWWAVALRSILIAATIIQGSYILG